MSRLLLPTLAILIALPVAAKDKPFERPVVVRVDVNSDGAVAAADAVGDLPEALASVAELATRDVLFEPARVNGRPAGSRTSVVVNMRFEPRADGTVSATALSVEAAKPKFAPPRYPMKAAQRGYGAHLVMRMKLKPDGSVDVANSGLHDMTLWKGSRQLEESTAYRDQFEAEVMRVIEHWRPVIEEVDGVAVSTTWRVPVTFCPPGQRDGCAKYRKATAPARESANEGIRLAQLRASSPQTTGS